MRSAVFNSFNKSAVTVLFPPGLSPEWMLQYILVKDLQTGSSYFFLVDEWLSVDNERTDGRVEIDVEASGNYQAGGK